MVTWRTFRYLYRWSKHPHIFSTIRLEMLIQPNGRCPSCSGVLLVRKGKYGKFLGCSNYPECKYTKNI